MKVLYFDCFSGVSGDMILASLIDLGIDQNLFLEEIRKLSISDEFEIYITKKQLSGISCTDVSVFSKTDNYHDNVHNHHHHSRNLEEIEHIIENSNLNMRVKSLSKKIFYEIAKAEAAVHGTSILEVHFHEVGAVDSIVDIVGASICIDLLGVERIFSSELRDGKGFIECQHGTIPVPVPAVLEMLKDSSIPLISTDIETELVTPTGLAILKCTSKSFGKMPPLTIEKIGYGSGKRNTGKFNALRVILGSLYEQDSRLDNIVALETNIDNQSPEILSYAMELLFKEGALDVYFTPIYMKKNRPSVMLTVLAKPEDESKMLEILFKETSTLGIRRHIVERYYMNREMIELDTQYGKAKVKVSSFGDYKKYYPEFEVLKDIAQKTGMPIHQIYNEVINKMNGLM